jgi:hypothetical protein
MPDSVIGARRSWRAAAWLVAASNAALATVFAVPAATIAWVGLSATDKTRSPEEYGAAMMFAMLGGMIGSFAIVLLALAVASGAIARRLRRRPAGIPTIIFLGLAGLGPPVLLACLIFLRH